ncbi:MAG: response regulator [Bacteroidales bacterium]|nr:response regulator [Bacteroidales bacterium]
MMTENHDFNILVIDDSTTNVVLLEAILKEKGYTINTALSAKEAYTILKNSKPDLILLDLLMPRISGFDFLEQIRNDLATADVPVIVITAVNDDEYSQKALKLGATEVLHKPVDIPILIGKVEQYARA